MLHAKPNNRFYENKLYKNIKVFVFVFEILLKVFVFVFKYICIRKYLYLYLYLIFWKVLVFVFKYSSVYLTTCLMIHMESVRGHWKTTANGERPGESRFAIQCSPRRSLFAASFPIDCFQCYLFKVRYSMFAVPFAIRRAFRHSPFASSFAAPFAIRCAVRHSPRHSLRHSPRRFLFIFAIQTSLFNVRRAVSHSQFAIRQSPSHSQFAAPFAVAFQCPLTLSIDT